MARRLPPVALVLAALLAQSRDRHELAFYLLVAAVPAAAVVALAAFGDLVESTGASPGALRARLAAALDALALALIVLSAAVRGQAPQDVGVPPLAASALVACLVVFAVQAFAALSAGTSLSAAIRVREDEARAGLR
jgi:hypothetical protein